MALALVLIASCVRSDVGESKAGETAEHPLSKSANSRPPNILLILADDLGYSDIGAFGGEISTPNIDRLAENGVMLTNFHVHAFCTPTRAMLLTGVNNHAAGIGTMAGEWRGEQKGAPGYETFLADRVVTVSSLLKDAGYNTYIAGKWDLGGRSDDSLLPDKRGFSRSYVLVEGSADHFREFPALAELSEVNYRENGKPVHPPESFYSSELYAQKLIEQIDADKATGKPFFAYLSFTAPHYPIQAPDEYIAKYDRIYDEGYDAIRNARLARMRARGVVAADTEAAAPDQNWPSWHELSPSFRAYEARRMQVYAAMVEAMDANIGRVIDHLEDIDELKNTMIVFLSDNGAEGGNPLDWAPDYYEWAEENFDLSLANVGRPHSFAWTGPQWAQVSSGPNRLFKAFPTRGGLLSPTIISFPGVILKGRMTSVMAAATDLPATFLDLAGVPPPGETYQGRTVAPIEGASLMPILRGEAERAHGDDQVFVWEIMDRRAVQKGDWKIVWINKPWGKGVGTWSLYDIRNDPAESRDLSEKHPDIVGMLTDAWEDYVQRNKLILADYSDVTYVNQSTHFDWLPDQDKK